MHTQSISVDDLIYLLNYVAYYLSLIDLHVGTRASEKKHRVSPGHTFACIEHATERPFDYGWSLCVRMYVRIRV